MAVCEWGLSPDDAWELSPQEWWTLWSWKYGKRKERMKVGLTDDMVEDLADGLEAELAKEGRTRG